MHRLRFSSAFLMLPLLISGCMLGPDFHSPKSNYPQHYTAKHLPHHTAATAKAGKAGVAQQFDIGANLPGEWWKLFHSHELNQLIQQGIDNSPNLAGAYAALRQAQENLNAQIGSTMFPAATANLAGQRQLFSGNVFGGDISNNLFNLFNANVSVSYTLDVFGGLRRQIEALGAQVDYQQFQLIGVYLALTSNIVTTAVTVSSLQAQIEATQALIQAQEEQLHIIQKQYELGGVSQANVLTQLTLVSQTRATLPQLEKNLAQNRHALAALIGGYPDAPLPRIRLNDLQLPRQLPVSLPSQMVRQRPDVRAAEELLHVASAQVGVATANLFPQFTLTGNYGWQAPTPATLFASTTNTWLYSGAIAQPIFNGGALRAQRRAAIAALDQSFAQYKQTVLKGFQNVADALRAIETDARVFRAQKAAEDAAFNNLALTQRQYRDGGASYLNLLNAQQQYQQVRINRIQAQAARYTDTAALFQALGGGWWNKPWCVKQCL